MPQDAFIVQPVSTRALLHDEEVRMFLREAPKKYRSGRSAMKVAVAFSLGAVLLYTLLFGDALWYSLTTPKPVLSAQQEINLNMPQPVITPTATPVATPKPVPTIPESTLYYADTQISIPITWDVSLDPQASQEGLKHGGIHILGTAKPGQTGMVSVSCHSSGYFWDSNPYKNACATLYKAQAGQKIEVNYQNTQYTYQVQKIYEAKPQDINILENNSGSGLRLITCTPIGTNWRRLVVEAVQIDPDPQNNTAYTGARFTGQLPKDR